MKFYKENKSLSEGCRVRVTNMSKIKLFCNMHCEENGGIKE